MVATFYKISHKSLGNYSFNHFQLCLCVYSLFSYLLAYQINKLRHFKIYLFKGEKSLTAVMEIVFTEPLLFGRTKWAVKNMRKFPSQVIVCFENNPKVFEQPLFSSTSLDDLVRKSKITGTLNIYSVVHRSLIKQLVCTYSLSQKERFSFESIINAGSFSLITTEKQGICGCLITSMYHDNI